MLASTTLPATPNYLLAESKIAQNAKASFSAKLSESEKEAHKLNDLGLTQIKARNFKAAEQTFQKALALDNHNVGVVYNLAGSYIVNKKEAEAVVLLEQYVKSAPPDAGLYARLGDAYFGSKNISNAAIAYEEAYNLDQSFPDLPGKLGTLYLLSNRLADAEKFLEIAAVQSQKDLRTLTNLSSVYLANAKPEKAIATAKKALQIKAGKELYVTLATAYELNKDYKNALISFQRASDLGDERDEIKRKIEALKKVNS